MGNRKCYTFSFNFHYSISYLFQFENLTESKEHEIN